MPPIQVSDLQPDVFCLRRPNGNSYPCILT